MTRSLEQQAKLFKTVASELVAITPPAWEAVEMIVRITWAADPDAAEIELELASPDGRPDHEIEISRRLEDAVTELLSELEIDGDRLVQLRAVSRRTGAGAWELDSDLAYEAPVKPRRRRRSPAS